LDVRIIGRVGVRLVLLLGIALSAAACGVLPPESPAATQETELACNEAPEGNWRVGDREIPEVEGWPPDQAAAAFDEADIAVSWRYNYATEPPEEETGTGYAECWCRAPLDGVVQSVVPSDGGWLIVMVERAAPMPGGRPQPALGWGCETT
jgi:hypothetical protein